MIHKLIGNQAIDGAKEMISNPDSNFLIVTISKINDDISFIGNLTYQQLCIINSKFSTFYA